MFSKHVRLCLLIVGLVALGLTPAAQAGTRSAKAHAPQPGFLQVLWRGVSQIFEKEGASIDPSGVPHSNTGSSGTSDEGSGIAPSGITHG